MKCDSIDDLLLDFVEGELPPDDEKKVQQHLDQCPACAVKCRETRALLGDLGVARSADGEAANVSDARTLLLDSAASPAAPKQIGDFKIIEELGRGGMGVVYRARQISLNRIVALKLLSSGLTRSERSVSRFAREAQAAARLHHTNVVPVYAQGHEGDCFYYAMELIEGESLDKVLRQARNDASSTRQLAGDLDRPATEERSGSSLNLLRSAASSIGISGTTRAGRSSRDFKRIARLVAEVADGLNHAHEQNVIHRDIKPQNLLLGPDDRLHITDFGLARLADEPGLTLSSEMVGTPSYMSPEQISNKGGGMIDRRADIYSLGVTLYEMLTYQRPFRGDTYEQVINQILKRDPRPPRKIDPRTPQDLETICLRAMEKEPHRRFPTASEMARDLRRYAEGFPIASRPLGPVGKALRWVRRRPWRASAIAASTLLVVALPLLFSFLGAWGNAQIDSAITILLNDYRDRGSALIELGWASSVGGDGYRREFTEAFAYIRTEPEKTIALLKDTVSGGRNDPDAHYLLAWAYARQTISQGAALWANAERHIESGDRLSAEPSAAGFFFRGQALFGVDSRGAVESYDQAIRRKTNFTQAMLHQARAMNQIMYSWRDNSYYRKAVGQLEHVALGQPTKAYPRYLRSITHMLAAEIFAEYGDEAESRKAYDASFEAASDAQIVESHSPRGYAAEAGYYESLGVSRLNSTGSHGDFKAAIAAWSQFDNPAIHKTASDKSERYAYQMRLKFWLGEFDEAERLRGMRYGEPSGYDRTSHYDADESLYEALLWAARGQSAMARRTLDEAASIVGLDPEGRLLLAAAHYAVGSTPPKTLVPLGAESSDNLSPGWDAEWLKALAGYLRGQLTWDEVVAASKNNARRNDDPRLRLTSANFYRGVVALRLGHRNEALAALSAASNERDNENYCFRAKFLLIRMQLDPNWPPWIAGRE